MKWSRKTKEFEYRDYISETGLRIRDMEINDSRRYREHIANGGQKTDYWGLIDADGNVIKWGKTVKRLKEYAETI